MKGRPRRQTAGLKQQQPRHQFADGRHHTWVGLHPRGHGFDHRAQGGEQAVERRQQHRADVDGQLRKRVREQPHVVGRGGRTRLKLAAHGAARARGRIELLCIQRGIARQHRHIVGVLEAKHVDQRAHALCLGQLFKGLQKAHERALGVLADGHRQPGGRQPHRLQCRLKRRPLLGCGLQPQQQRVDGRARHLGCAAHGDERARQRRRLVGCEAKGRRHPAHARQRAHDLGCARRALVGNLVDGVTEPADFGDGYLVHVGHLGHGVAGLGSGHVKGHRHFGRGLDKGRQVLQRHAQLAAGSGQGRDLGVRQRQGARHAHDRT